MDVGLRDECRVEGAIKRKVSRREGVVGDDVVKGVDRGLVMEEASGKRGQGARAEGEGMI